MSVPRECSGVGQHDLEPSERSQRTTPPRSWVEQTLSRLYGGRDSLASRPRSQRGGGPATQSSPNTWCGSSRECSSVRCCCLDCGELRHLLVVDGGVAMEPLLQERLQRGGRQVAARDEPFVSLMDLGGVKCVAGLGAVLLAVRWQRLLSSLSALGGARVGCSCPGFSDRSWAVRRPDEWRSLPGQDRWRARRST
jgi:hypothetical protein